MSSREDAVMTVREVSEYLKLAESTVYKLAQEGSLPGRKIGGNWRFSRRVLEEWLETTGEESSLVSQDGRSPNDLRDPSSRP